MYSEEARRKKIRGSVLISLVVDVQGMPTKFRVERALGSGLDEKAVEAVIQYRFRPATKNGEPISKKILIEVNFQIF